MMRPQPATIRLGTEQWQVRPLTVAQVQAIEPLVFRAGEGKGGSVEVSVAILRIALERDHAAAAAALDGIEAGAPDIASAMSQVLRLGGFLPHGDADPGEADAGRVRPDSPASTGPASTPA